MAPESVHKAPCNPVNGALHLGAFADGYMVCCGCGVMVPKAQLNRRIPLDADNTVDDSGCAACRKAARKRGW